MTDYLSIALGLILLTTGGELLVRGSLAVARKLEVSPLLSGLVIVGFGTSAPELAVSVDAALTIRPDIAIGNVVGSNIGNILLILGLCAVITPLAVRPLALYRDAIAVVGGSVMFAILTADGLLSLANGTILLALLAGYLVWAYWTERNHAVPSAELHEAEAAEINIVPASWTPGVISIFSGLLLLIGGSKVLLAGAIGLAENFGVSEAVIGLTLVAVGTSLPEMSVSIIATFRGHADVAVGNVLGSNIFNVLGILGVSTFMRPLSVHGRILDFDQWVMLGSALLLLLFLYTGRKVGRLEGATLLTGYILYVGVGLTVLG